ncbi:MAG: hypothetical protein HKN16_03875, partial [Saprospiraceae bacterium]|nr:hypothetical protein [Saprospiraceae bacterium]
AGTYRVTVTDQNGCTRQRNVVLTEPVELTFTANSTDPSDCGFTDGTITILAAGGIAPYEYSIDGSTWQASNFFSTLAPGTYFTYVRNAGSSCVTGPIGITINAAEAPIIDNITIINPSTPSSNDGGLLINASGNGLAIEFSLDGVVWQLSNLFNGLDEGTYTVRVRYQGLNCVASSIVTLVAGGGVVGTSSGEDYCSEDISGVTFLEEYYIPLPEDQALSSFLSMYPASCGGSTNPVDPIVSYNSVGIVETGSTINYDHWEDGYEVNIGFPLQATTEIWGDGNIGNGMPPGYVVDVLNAGDIIVLQSNVVSTTRGTVIDFDGGDKMASRGNLAVTRLAWPTGPGTFFAGALEIYPTISWGTQFEVPVGEDENVNDMFDYVGAVIMAFEDNTSISIDVDADGTPDIVQTLNEGDSRLVDGALNAGATINASAGVQVHLITGHICASYETRWFTLQPVQNWSDSYFNPVATQQGSGDANDPTYVHLYNPNNFGITVSWETESGAQSDINIGANDVADREVPEGEGSHFFTTTGDVFYAIATIDSEDSELVHDWGFAILPESQLTGQITMVGFAPGENPTMTPSGSNTSPIWITPGYPAGSSFSGPVTICIDYNGDGGPLNDLNGTPYDASRVVNELGMLTIYDPDGDQTGMRIWVCDGSDAVIAGAYGQDPSTSGGSG